MKPSSNFLMTLVYVGERQAGDIGAAGVGAAWSAVPMYFRSKYKRSAALVALLLVVLSC